jgi:Glycosyl hydrolases family 16
MSPLTSPIRAAAAVVVIALGANVGIASASAKSHVKSKTHVVKKAKVKKATATTASVKKAAVKKPAVVVKRKPAPAPVKTTPTKTTPTPTKTTPTTTTPTTTTPTKTTPTTTTPTTTTPTTTTPTTTTPTTTTPTTTTPTTTTPTTTTPTTTTPTTTTPTTTTPTSTTPEPTGISGNWKLALDSEFTGSSLPAPWSTGWFGSGMTAPVNSSEQDCYSPNNVTFPGDGSLHLAVTATSSSCGGATKPYTGAMITTDPADRSSGGFQYTYGVMEARVYVPAAGTQIANWPAVWTDGQSWPNDGEDDLMEGLSGQACWHFHDPLGGPGGCSTTVKPGWHTFASDWQPGSVTYYYDGTEVGSITSGITTAPQYILLDDTVASGGALTADSMQVQYVRVWQS